MAVLSDYVSGTISLTNGSVDFTGAGTSWQLAQIREGDTIFYLPGTAYQGVISEITSNVAGKLDRAWEGPDLVAVEYRIRFLSDGSRATSQSAMLREQLGNGNIQALAGLTGSNQQVPMFTGPGAMTLVPKGDFINGVAVDKRVNNLAERAAYDGQAEGFSIYVANVGDGRAATYFKETAASGDWSDPAYVTGPVGPPPVIEAEITQTAPGTAPDVTVTPITGGYELDFGLPLVRGAGFQFQFSDTTADANPGAGLWRANNAAFASATQLFISKTSDVGADVAAFLASIGTSTSPNKGTLVQQRLSDGATASWTVTGVTDASGYVKVGVSGYSGPAVFAVDDLSMLQFMKSGNAGAGTGDVVGPATSVDSRLAEFSGTTGKLLKDGGVVISTFAKTMLDDATATAARTTLAAFGVIRVQILTASGNYTPHANMLYAEVHLQAAGGGSAGSTTGTSQNGGGTGGSGGGYCRKLFSRASLGTLPVAVSLGAIGTAGNPGASGSSAGNSSFGSFLTANGGQFGTFSGPVSISSTAIGISTNTGGAATGGDVNIAGEPGGSTIYPSLGQGALSGKGGDSVLGRGGKPTNSGSPNGNAGTGYGSGGGGASTSGVQNGSGANGQPAICIIIEYCSE